MNEFPFQKFIDLVAFDQATNKLEREHIRLEREAEQCKKEILKARVILDESKKRFITSKKEVDAKELEMKELDAKQKEKQKVLDRITNQREVQSVYQEIENLKKKQHDFEEQLLAVWHKLEAANREYSFKKEEIDKQIQELEKSLDDYGSQQKDIKASLEQQYKERPGKEIGLPSEWIEKYEMMRRAVTNPVVPVVNGNCSACFYNLPQQDMAQLRRHVMLQCKECYRFLYME
jgi:uncharacterized protein